MINERLIGPARGPRPPCVQLCPTARAAIAVALVAGALGPAAPVVAEVINGTSGSNTDATAYSTDGNLSLTLGFFADYLVVGGGGGGGGVAGQAGGNGGAGRISTITGAQVSYAGGGGGGGINGDPGSTSAGPAGTGQAGGGNGGSGVVIVRYQGAPAATGGDRSAGNRFAKHRSSSADIPRRKVSQAAPPLENRS